MDSKQLALLVRGYAENKKAEDLKVLDLRELSTVADYMVLCTGTSEPHLRAIRDEIEEGLRRDHGVRPRAVDGGRESLWVVLDYFDVLVQVMRGDVRGRYDIEGLWGDAPVVRARKLAKKKAAKA
ncbi:MAG: ribosome silencing factor [Limisphaerales bacterium]